MNSEFILFDIDCPAEVSEILIAELSFLGVDSFLEKDAGFEFSVTEDHPAYEEICQLLTGYKNTSGIVYTHSVVAKTDWNREWENNFQPVCVEDHVLVRAPFHTSDNKFGTEIIIQPKMSFGTGHHETTYMMIRAMMTIDFKDKSVLDAGCGTGILSIYARKKGSGTVTAIDIDDWAVENATENIGLNNISGIEVVKGTVADINDEIKFGIILANINRNVLLNELAGYATRHLPGGNLILSGFYENDAGQIVEKAVESGYEPAGSFSRNGWSSLVFKRNSDYFS